MGTRYRHLRDIVSVLAVAMLLLGAMAFLGGFQEPAGAATAAQMNQDLDGSTLNSFNASPQTIKV